MGVYAGVRATSWRAGCSDAAVSVHSVPYGGGGALCQGRSASLGVVDQRLPGQCACTGHTAIGRPALHVAHGVVAGRVRAAADGGDGMGVAAVAIGVRAERGAGQPPPRVVALCYSVLQRYSWRRQLQTHSNSCCLPFRVRYELDSLSAPQYHVEKYRITRKGNNSK